MLVGVRRTGAIQFIKVLLLYGTPTNGVYSSSMASKKRSSSKPPTPIKLSNIKGVTKTNKPAGSAVGGKKYKTPKNAQPAYSGPKVTGSKTPIKQSGKGFANSGGTLSSGLAGSNLSKGNIARAASVAVGGGAVGRVASAFKVSRGVSEAAKKLQRELSSELKSESTKGMSKAQRNYFYESRSELMPGESSRLTQYDLRKSISESMKTNKGKLKVNKKRR